MSGATPQGDVFVLEANALVELVLNFNYWRRPVAECLTGVYGADGEREFWKFQCSEPVPVRHFVDLFTHTLDQSELESLGLPPLLPRPVAVPPDVPVFSPPVDPDDACRLAAVEQNLDMKLRAALVDAYQAHPANLAMFAGDTSSLKTARYGRDLRRELKVDVRKIAEWFLEKPRRQHLVPRSLARSLARFVTDHTSEPHSSPGGESDVTMKGAPRGDAAAMRGFLAWGRERGSRPTKRDCEGWAKGNGISTHEVRKWHREHFPAQRLGRPNKSNSENNGRQ